MKKYPLISIVISNYNGARLDTLKACLVSFKKIDYPNYELILVDNASTDNSLVVAKKVLGKDPKFKIIQNRVNMYSQGLNLGLKESRGEYVAYFNNDLEVAKKYFQKLVESFNRYPKLALAQGKLLWYFDHKIIDSAGESMDPYGNPVTIGYQTKDRGQFDNDEEILSASGSACMLKKSALKNVGIYDDSYGIGYEDMDLGLRLRHRGFLVMRVPEAIVYHKRGTTDLSPMVRVKVKWHFNKNRLATMIKNYPLSDLLQTIPITLVIYIFNMLWEMGVQKRFRVGLMRPWAVIWIFMQLPRLLQERQAIRNMATDKTDQTIIKLLAPSSIFIKVKNVITDYFTPIKNPKSK